ncbi:hypothetical protein C8J57DRAFT_1721182, partial [Mycena rebaudengoi]
LVVSYHHLRCTVSSKSPLLPATSSYKDNWNLPTYSTSIFCRWHRSPLRARLSTGYRERTRWTRVCTVVLLRIPPGLWPPTGTVAIITVSSDIPKACSRSCTGAS